MMHLVPFFRVPELARNPFHNLKKLTFEAAKLPHHVAKFILGHSCSLTELVLILDELSVENFKGRHTKLCTTSLCKWKLESVCFNHSLLSNKDLDVS